MEALSISSSIIFILTTFITVFFFWKATAKSTIFLAMMITWLALQSVVGLNGFYKITDTTPPRFILLILPPLLLIIGLFVTKSGRAFIDRLDIRWLTLLHTIRIPVEIVLLLLFIQKLVPGIMTFEGRNLDILSGISAGVVYFFALAKGRMNSRLLIAWNFICLALLLNIVVIAVLSAPFAFQRFGFDQPNVALLAFPYVWLPCCVVPLVLFSHVASLRQLLVKSARQLPAGSLA